MDSEIMSRTKRTLKRNSIVLSFYGHGPPTIPTTTKAPGHNKSRRENCERNKQQVRGYHSMYGRRNYTGENQNRKTKNRTESVGVKNCSAQSHLFQGRTRARVQLQLMLTNNGFLRNQTADGISSSHNILAYSFNVLVA